MLVGTSEIFDGVFAAAAGEAVLELDVADVFAMAVDVIVIVFGAGFGADAAAVDSDWSSSFSSIDIVSGSGDEGGDVFISITVTLLPFFFASICSVDSVRFNGDLLPNCKNAVSLGKMSLTSWI